MRVYRTMRTFLGMDEGQQLWQVFDEKHYCIAWAVSDGESEDEVAKAIENVVDVTPHIVHRRKDAEKFAVMLKHDEITAQMLDGILLALIRWWDEDYFVINDGDEWWVGHERGRKSNKMPSRVPSRYDRRKYMHGYALGMMEKLARKTKVDYDFIETWVVPYKAKENPYGE